jgi:hypothetical protein
MTVADTKPAGWLLLMFSLPARKAGRRVEVWRKLRRYGALTVGSGYLLPADAANEERFQWLATQVRKYGGEATIAQASAFQDLSSAELERRFSDERAREYAEVSKELQRLARRKDPPRQQVTSLRRRVQDIATRDFFQAPARSRVEALLARLEAGPQPDVTRPQRRREFLLRTWVTRPRPKIDRAASAWLIRRFIDPNATFVFAESPKRHPKAIPYDMYSAEGFGHRGEDCTFETLVKEFGIADPRVKTIAQAVHDADLGDERYGRPEADGLNRVLHGWAHQGIADDELLRRGMELLEGLYQSL